MSNDQLIVGTCLDGTPLTVPGPWTPHMLIGGVSGAGKSVFMSCLIGALACLPVALLGIDLKVVELWAWRDRFTTIATDITTADRLLGQLRLLVKQRRALLAEHGLRDWTPELGPYVYVFADELAELAGIDPERLAGLVGDDTETPSDMKRVSDELNQVLQYGQRAQKARMAVFSSLARVCRFCGITIIAATQYPTAEVVDQQLRTQLAGRVLLRVASDEQIKVILGQTMPGITVDSIPPSERGGMWVYGLPGLTTPIRARSYDVPDHAITKRVAHTAHQRIHPDALFGDPTTSNEEPY